MFLVFLFLLTFGQPLFIAAAGRLRLRQTNCRICSPAITRPTFGGRYRGEAGSAHGCPGYTWLSRRAPPFPALFLFSHPPPFGMPGKAHPACVLHRQSICAPLLGSRAPYPFIPNNTNTILGLWYLVPIIGV